MKSSSVPYSKYKSEVDVYEFYTLFRFHNCLFFSFSATLGFSFLFTWIADTYVILF